MKEKTNCPGKSTWTELMSFIHALWLSFCAFHRDSFILEGFYHAFDRAVVGAETMCSASQWNLFSIKENRFCDTLLKDKQSPQADTGNYHKTNCLIRPTNWLQIPDLSCVGCILSHMTIASKAVQDIAMHIITATYHEEMCIISHILQG
jgi:hypothetical protein